MTKRAGRLFDDPLYRRIEDTSPNIKARNTCLEIGGQLLLRHYASGDCHTGGKPIDLVPMFRRSPWTVGGIETIVRQRIHAIAGMDLYLVGMTSRVGCNGVVAILFEAARQFQNRSGTPYYPDALYGEDSEDALWAKPSR